MHLKRYPTGVSERRVQSQLWTAWGEDHRETNPEKKCSGNFLRNDIMPEDDLVEPSNRKVQKGKKKKIVIRNSDKWRTMNRGKTLKEEQAERAKVSACCLGVFPGTLAGAGCAPGHLKWLLQGTSAKTCSRNSYVKMRYLQSRSRVVCMQPHPCQSLYCKILDDYCSSLTDLDLCSPSMWTLTVWVAPCHCK